MITFTLLYKLLAHYVKMDRRSEEGRAGREGGERPGGKGGGREGQGAAPGGSEEEKGRGVVWRRV